jgi:hypothetical protein
VIHRVPLERTTPVERALAFAQARIPGRPLTIERAKRKRSLRAVFKTVIARIPQLISRYGERTLLLNWKDDVLPVDEIGRELKSYLGWKWSPGDDDSPFRVLRDEGGRNIIRSCGSERVDQCR